MDFSIDVFDCDWLKEGYRAAVMPDTGAVSSGPRPFWNIGKRLTDAREHARAGAGRRARERRRQFPGLFLVIDIIDIVKEL